MTRFAKITLPKITLPPRARAWYQAARPRSLTATFVPMALAAAIALGDNVFDLVRFLLSLIAAVSLQVAANLINEYVDHVRGSDEKKVAGMGMVIKGNLLTPRDVLLGAIVTVLVGVVIGLYLVSQSGPLVFYIGVVGVLVVVLYTAGPAPLAYLGLGELSVFITMGPLMVLGGYYVLAAGKVNAGLLVTPILASLPIACTIANILHANNLRDLDADRAANKRTLAARFGLHFARLEYLAWMIGAYLSLVFLVAGQWLPPLTLIALATIPEALRLVNTANTTIEPLQLHILQGKTARFHRDFGAMIVIGYLAWIIIRALLNAR